LGAIDEFNAFGIELFGKGGIDATADPAHTRALMSTGLDATGRDEAVLPMWHGSAL